MGRMDDWDDLGLEHSPVNPPGTARSRYEEFHAGVVSAHGRDFQDMMEKEREIKSEQRRADWDG